MRARAGVVLASVLLAGCSAGGTDGPAPTMASTQRASAEDFAQLMQSCLGEAGWEVSIAADGSFEASIPQDQADQFEQARAECERRFGYDQPPPPLDRAAAEEYVDALEAAARCLRDNGYDVPEQPSRSQSIDGLMSPSLDPGWDVYGSLTDGAALEEAQATCPVEP